MDYGKLALEKHKELKGKIIGELSVADTLLTNGVKTSPKSRP